MNFFNFIGKTIEDIIPDENYDGDVASVLIKFTDGSFIEIEPTQYNYGGQHLNVEIGD